MNSNNNKTGYLPALDGLRGLAIILVLGCHFFFKIGIFKLGWIGVDLFFVLSGYLITSKFIRQPINLDIVKIFYRNRILRILPLYFAFLLFFMGIWYLLPAAKAALLYIPSINGYWGKHFFFVQNWMYAFCTSDAEIYSPLMHLWSVAIEEQFYIFFPLIILILSKTRHKVVLIGVAILLIVFFRSYDFYYHGLSVNKLYYYCNTFYRLDTFLAGVLLAYLLRDIKNNKYLDIIYGWLLLVSFCGYIFIVSWYNDLLNDNPLIITIGYTVIAAMFMSLIYFTVLQKSKVLNKIFTNRFLVFSGKISYGLYIFHFPFDFFKYSILHSYFKFLLRWGHEELVLFLFTCFLIGILYLVSYISYTYYERYFLRMKKTYAGAVPIIPSV